VTPTTSALQRETRTIPIVFANVGDPVASGIVPRLDRPGGNVTGFALFEATLGGKWIELLSEIAPGLKRAAIMFDSAARGRGARSTATRSQMMTLALKRVQPDDYDVIHSGEIVGRNLPPRSGLRSAKKGVSAMVTDTARFVILLLVMIGASILLIDKLGLLH
jgi:hypothetical protein